MDNPNYSEQLTAISVKRIARHAQTLAAIGYPYVVDGVNADDLRDYRPGIQAAKNEGAITLRKWVLLKPKYANSQHWVCLGGINQRLRVPASTAKRLLWVSCNGWEEQNTICGRWG